MDDTIYVYADGTAIENGRNETKCGWSCKLIYHGHERMKSGRCVGKTNNEINIIAVLMAMRSITDKSIPVEIFSGSDYVVKILNGKWDIRHDKDLRREVMTEKMRFVHIEFALSDYSKKTKHVADVVSWSMYEAELAGI